MDENKFKQAIRLIFGTGHSLIILSLLVLWQLDSINPIELGSIITPLLALMLYIPAFTFKDFLQNPYEGEEPETNLKPKKVKRKIVTNVIFKIILHFIILMITIWFYIANRSIDLKLIVGFIVILEGYFGIFVKAVIEQFFKKK